MSSRRWGVGVAVVATTLVVIGSGWLLLQPRGGADVSYRDAAGGFTLTLSSSWRVHPHDSAGQPWNWISADRSSRLGPPDAWLWLNRSTPGGTNQVETIARYSMDDIRRHWGHVHVVREQTTFAGHRALRLRYSHPILKQLASIPGSDAEEIRLITESAGQVYELGVVGWRGLPFDELEHVLHLTTPRGVRTIGDRSVGVHIAVPGSWNREVTDPQAKGVVMTAADPFDPHEAWTVIWRLEGDVETAVSNSADKAARQGTIVRRSQALVAGRPATRIDFTRKTALAPTYYSTWIFAGADGTPWQLLVGASTDMKPTATAIAASLQFFD